MVLFDFATTVRNEICKISVKQCREQEHARESMLIQFRGHPGNRVKFAQTFGDVMLKVDVHNGVNSVPRLP